MNGINHGTNFQFVTEDQTKNMLKYVKTTLKKADCGEKFGPIF